VNDQPRLAADALAAAHPAPAQHPPTSPGGLRPGLDEDQFDQEAWDEWYRERIRRSLEDPRPPISHAELVAATSQFLSELEVRHVSKAA
jgi:hypothetical protein